MFLTGNLAKVILYKSNCSQVFYKTKGLFFKKETTIEEFSCEFS